MPSKALRPCCHVGCNKLVDSGYCDDHKIEVKRKYDPSEEKYRATASSRGYDYRWQLFRNKYLQYHQFCVKCQEKNIITLSSMIHHIIALKDGGDKYNYNNLMALCRDCHEIIEGRKHDN